MSHFPLYVNGLQPRDMLVYAAASLAGAAGIALSVVTDEQTRSNAIVLRCGAAFLVGVAALVAIPVLPSGVHDSSGSAQAAITEILPPDSRDRHDLRIAGPDDATTRWINVETPTPQVRGYDDHGALHLDWQTWLENSLKDSATSDLQRRWLLDWYGIGWLYSDDATGRVSPESGRPEQYEAVGSRNVYGPVSSWRVRDPHPITTAATGRTVLVVGDTSHYDLVLHALAAGATASSAIIPLHGPAAADDLTSDEIANADTIFLYGAGVRNAPAVDKVLLSYVSKGGRLVVDAGDTPDAAAIGSRGDLLPVTAVGRVEVRDVWSFTGPESSDMVGFSPPVFGTQSPWSVTVPAGNGLSPNATVDVFTAATNNAGGARVVQPVVATRLVGAGTVRWTGLNLPFHAVVYDNPAEARTLVSLLATGPAPATGVAVNAVRHNAESRSITVPAGVRRVLVKEYSYPNWHASLDGRELPILRAGPDMMLIPVGPEGGTVVMSYQLGIAEVVGLGLSIVSLLALLFGVALAPRLRHVRVVRGIPLPRPRPVAAPLDADTRS